MEDMFCKSCRWWDQRYPENLDLGACMTMGIILINDAAAINLRPGIELSGSRPTSDVREVRTQALFGCIEHTRTGELLTSRELRYYQEGRPK